MRFSFLLLIAFALSGEMLAEGQGKAALQVNRRMMEDKKLVGVQAGFFLPIGALSKEVGVAVGGGVKGKYFGTNYFAFSFDVAFAAPKIKTDRLALVRDSIFTPQLERYQQRNLLNDSIRVAGVSGSAQYIPINLSFEFYLPSQAMKNFRPYAGIGLGIHVLNRNYHVRYNCPQTMALQMMQDEVQPSTSRGYFTLHPTIGFLATIDELFNISFDIKYNQFIGEQRGGSFSAHLGVILDLGFKYVR